MKDFNNILKKLDNTYNHSADPLLLQNNSGVYIISGRKGVGKTTMCMNLLQSKLAYKKRFENIFMISPTGRSDAKLKKLVDELEEDGKFFDTFSDELIENILDQIKADNEEHEKKNRHLIILDDCVLDLSKKRASILNKLVITARHNNITLLILTQKYNAIPTIIRANSDLISFFNSFNKKEIETLQDDINIDKEIFKDVYNQACMDAEGGHSFLHINLLANPVKFYKNFTPMDVNFQSYF
jgi:polyhydroxyalkanoate synthesis regulator phasin